MGSKRSIIDFVETSINEILLNNQRIYDLFGGSAAVSANYRNVTPVSCNDIQSYTSVLAKTYLQNYYWENFNEDILDEILNHINVFKRKFFESNQFANINYNSDLTFDETKGVETIERNFVKKTFNPNIDHLFTKNFSGTFWSSQQCIEIDAISYIARNFYCNTFLYNIIISSLMFAMSYTSQSTGHYAQFRELTNDNLKDILFYRNKSLIYLFKQKFLSLKEFYNGENNSEFNHQYTTLDYLEALDNMEYNSLVYADPPYQFVHYSRFYHALETLVKYDYPELKYKGRYRTDRHQSPFSIKTKVQNAFKEMFVKIFEKQSSLVLSYSNTGMISLEEIVNIGSKIFINYSISIKEIEYKHSTMGRQNDKHRDVLEAIIIFKL
ncbi:DNA adenine methylase [Sphingobacterium spiritivorum]|uniref:DNA adenine methylase n=1 Tax=Sphingobacterium spiritivorum TaxID=258 RepID=UPI003DA63F40